ncbi:MAG: GntR family transcriptional regulator [Victivallaceae bacterium]|nr:GntR family transcriptional regulator [Victivallaceae bacterium]
MSTNAIPFKYQKLKEYFVHNIRNGKLTDNTRVPSEPELMKQYSLSRNTIRQTMKELENAGYLYRVRGKGTFVRTAHPEVSQKIALIIFDSKYSAHPLVRGMICGIDEVLSRNGYLLDILASRRSGLEADINRLAVSYAGFLIGAWQIDKNIVRSFIQKHIPHIFVKNYFPGVQENAVMIDFENAGKTAAEHLAKLGHRNLALFYAGENINISRDFKAGVVTACLDHGIRLRHENIIDLGFNCDKVTAAVDFLSGSRERVSAIITMDDDIAASAVRRLEENGLTVPDDISVTGCNDMPIASLVSPALTTVAIPIEELGRKAAEILVKRLKGEGGNFKGLKLFPELIVRESTAQAKNK